MKLLFVLVSLIGGLITASRYASAVDCEVSLPQHESNPVCKTFRNDALARNKKIYTLKHDEALHGFALLNMTRMELGKVALKDPFMRYYTATYLGMAKATEAIFKQYIKSTPEEIDHISEYLVLAKTFQSAPEPILGENMRLQSRYEEFNNKKTKWISDKLFTQQRLAGSNPMSIIRVTYHEEEKRRCTVKTEDGRWCHFPFRYRGKVYRKCTTDGFHKPWCSTTETYKRRWGVCEEKDHEEKEAKDCTVKTTIGEWCHFPFYYKGVKYEECTKKDSFLPWCATNDKYKWGVCAEIIPKKPKQGPVGLDWNKLKETLNPEFDWEAAVQAALKTEDSLEDAIDQGLIYALRYELCDDMMRSPDLTDKDPNRTMWNFLSPIALFASANAANAGHAGQYNELVPVAIQMDFKPDSRVYTPKDGDNWLIAKLNVQVTDIGYAQIVEHLAKCHYFMEPFCVSLKRTLPPMHPLNQILKYHCREIIVPNTFGTPALLNEKSGFVDLLFAYGNDGATRLLRDAHASTTWEVTDFRGNIKKRGLADKRLLPYLPYRDDGTQILEVIEHMVETYVSLYYKQDKDVKEDVELQAYLNEVSLNGIGENGGIGRIQGLPPSVNSKVELCEIVSRIISQLTLQHAAVNFPISDYAMYPPNQPTKLYDDTRVEEEEFSVYRLPNRLTSAVQCVNVLGLGRLRIDILYDYGNKLDDIKAVNLVNSCHGYLMDVVQPLLQELNRERKKSGLLTYPYLIPRWLPNGIQT